MTEYIIFRIYKYIYTNELKLYVWRSFMCGEKKVARSGIRSRDLHIAKLTLYHYTTTTTVDNGARTCI